MGRQKAMVLVGKANPLGITPLTTHVSSSSRILVPTTDRSPPKRRRQRPSLIRIAQGAPARSSSRVSARPMAGQTPRTLNASAVIETPSSRSGSPLPTRLDELNAYAPMNENDVDISFQDK